MVSCGSPPLKLIEGYTFWATQSMFEMKALYLLHEVLRVSIFYHPLACSILLIIFIDIKLVREQALKKLKMCQEKKICDNQVDAWLTPNLEDKEGRSRQMRVLTQWPQEPEPHRWG